VQYPHDRFRGTGNIGSKGESDHRPGLRKPPGGGKRGEAQPKSTVTTS
jgi:hypothetical protein